MTNNSSHTSRRDESAELLAIVDEQGNSVGKASREDCHNGSKLLHAVVHLHVFNTEGDLFLQKRPQWKLIQPGKWDTAVGGHVAYKEDIIKALYRETEEEIGLTDFTPEHLLTYLFESDRERELVYVYRTVTDHLPVPSAELDGGRFFTRQEILNAMTHEILTPNFIEEIRHLGWI